MEVKTSVFYFSYNYFLLTYFYSPFFSTSETTRLNLNQPGLHSIFFTELWLFSTSSFWYWGKSISFIAYNSVNYFVTPLRNDVYDRWLYHSSYLHHDIHFVLYAKCWRKKNAVILQSKFGKFGVIAENRPKFPLSFLSDVDFNNSKHNMRASEHGPNSIPLRFSKMQIYLSK